MTQIVISIVVHKETQKKVVLDLFTANNSRTPLSTTGHTQPEHFCPELSGTDINTGLQVSPGTLATIGHNISSVLLNLSEGGILVPVVQGGVISNSVVTAVILVLVSLRELHQVGQDLLRIITGVTFGVSHFVIKVIFNDVTFHTAAGAAVITAVTWKMIMKPFLPQIFLNIASN